MKINNNKYPVPKKIPFTLKKFDSERVDNYYWLNQRDDDEVIEHLKKENNYYLKKTRQTKNFQKKVFKEIKAKIKEDEERMAKSNSPELELTESDNKIKDVNFLK